MLCENVSKYGVFSGPYLPAFGLNTGRYARIRTEDGEIRSISPYSVRMRENTDQKKLSIWTLFTPCYAQIPIFTIPDSRVNVSFLFQPKIQ